MKILSQDSRYPGQDSNSAPTENKSRALLQDKSVRSTSTIVSSKIYRPHSNNYSNTPILLQMNSY
jgi:hypothetical protein